MNILIITQYFWPEIFRINDLALGLKERGYKVEILTGKPNYPKGGFFPGYGFWTRSREEYQGIPVTRVPLVRRAGGGRCRLVLNYLSFAFFASLWVLFTRRTNDDLIFVYQPSPVTVGLPAVLFKKRKGIPLFFWVQDLWPESLFDTGYIRHVAILNCVRRVVRWIYERCNFILVQSRAFFPYIQAYGIEEGRIFYFPNSTEDFYRPISAKENIINLQEFPKGFCVLFAGSIGEAQDFGTLLAAAERLKSDPEIHWVIFGEGRKRPWVEDQVKIRGLGGCFHLMGWRDPMFMPHYFSMAGALLVSLKGGPIFATTIPAKVQSYLACGKPIISALDGEGSRVIEESGAGIVSPSGDPEALADAVLKMFRLSEKEREAMGHQGRLYFERNFDRNILLDRLDSLIQKTVLSHREWVKCYKESVEK